MKRAHSPLPRIASAAVLLAVAPVWSAGQSAAAQIPAAPSNLTLVASHGPSDGANPFVRTSAAAGHAVVVTQWTDIKDNTFEERAYFMAGLEQLQARVDLQISELASKRAIMEAGGTQTQAWDFAMKEMENARSYLRSMGDEAGIATRDNWDQMKAKVASAWLRTQNAYGKVNASTTM